jgi:hypothetical protein
MWAYSYANRGKFTHAAYNLRTMSEQIPDREPALTPREAAHLRARDRKRSTRMVVDNAGVKRVLLALRDRAARSDASGAKAGSGAPRRGGT